MSKKPPMPKSHELLFQHIAPLPRLSLFLWEDFFLMGVYTSKTNSMGTVFLPFKDNELCICMPCLVHTTRNSLCLMMFSSIFTAVCILTSSFLNFHILGTMYSPNHTQFMQYFPSQSVCVSSSIQGAQTRQVSMC